MPFKFYLETYGCSLNMADSDLIVGRLHHLDAERVDTIENANIVILNTCGVKEPTEDRIIHRLKELSTGSQPVIVTGCLPRISFNRLSEAIPGFAAILGPQSLESLGPIVERVIAGERGILHLDSDSTSKLNYFQGPPDSVICTIPICEGCVGDCAYCAVKFARTTVQSYPSNEIVDILRRCVHLGYKEIRLTAQDAGAFGHDTGESLSSLLFEVGLIAGNHRIRLGMFNPNLVKDNLTSFLDSMSSERFFRFFHVPLQSGSNRILRLMNRYYTVEEWEEVVSHIITRFPDATIATDIIVGFPGETDADFQDTLNILQSVRPSVINVSKYGDRPGTKSSKSTEKVDTDVKKNRSRQLSLLVADIISEKNQDWIGWEGPVLITGNAAKEGFQCRTHTYKPVIVHDMCDIGHVVNVRITEGHRTHLIGSIV
ncbi:MAG: tRNA (N(6)-L-threonylcarbamoyladenosine(37)-C(2))-methylthiotransferase [Candidatus Thorarchaeota archaeon]|nr:tRNA (N(6)-L-threonylcarbamoyladenosine(37)-C(2))-methylthiotransferase [Candidatus Thorarchaeota archaeon]